MTNREQKLLPSARQLTSVRRTSNLNSLTGLPERLDFLRQVQQLLTEKKLNGWCVLSIDIEHFKLFNNWYGQVQGDELLHTIGHQLAQLAKENDYIAGYFGGDDFFLCMPDDDKRAQAVYDLIFHCIEDYQQLDGFLPLLGICPVDEHSDDISVLCNNAQIASGAVRGKLNHRICRFSEQIMQQLEKHQRLLSDVRIGIQRGEFTFYLQPKCNSLTGSQHGGACPLESPGNGACVAKQLHPIAGRNRAGDGFRPLHLGERLPHNERLDSRRKACRADFGQRVHHGYEGNGRSCALPRDGQTL